jgi:hypothetical protein
MILNLMQKMEFFSLIKNKKLKMKKIIVKLLYYDICFLININIQNYFTILIEKNFFIS